MSFLRQIAGTILPRSALTRAMSSSPKDKRSSRMVWIDCEMTGLDPDADTLLEVAAIVTEADLSVVAEGPNLVIHHPDQVLDNMGEWCTKHHGDSGLTAAVKDSKVV